MKKLLFILLLIPMMAFAGHHRSHALFFIDDAKPRYSYSLTDLEELKLVNEFAGGWPPEEAWLRAKSLITSIVSDLDILEALLQQPVCSAFDVDVMLIAARRMVNQPVRNTLPGERSILFKSQSAMYAIAQLLERVEPGELDMSVYIRLVRRLTEAWDESERVLWHINDAYREEIINRPEQGVGHDPFIDPVGFGQAFIFNPCDNQ